MFSTSRLIFIPLVLSVFSLTAAPARQAPSGGSSLAVVRIHTEQGATVPGNFMGLSHEWPAGREMIGYSKTGANLIYRQLLTNLTSFGSDPIELRIGGNSTDNNGKPGGDRMKPYAEIASSLHSPFMLGISLGSNDLSLSQNQVQFYLSEMPKGSIEAFELGNEPDHYPKRKMRPEPYAVTDYLQDFQKWKTGLLPLFPKGILLAAPSWAAPNLVPDIGRFVEQEADSIGVVSLHFYAGSPSNPPADYLLKPSSVEYGPKLFAPAIAAAHSKNLPFRITELNSYYGVGV